MKADYWTSQCNTLSCPVARFCGVTSLVSVSHSSWSLTNENLREYTSNLIGCFQTDRLFNKYWSDTAP